jgi:hypothetical protein
MDSVIGVSVMVAVAERVVSATEVARTVTV